jgi:putative restriction endonuclease
MRTVSSIRPEDWITRVTSLNQWKRNGERAPHKPLLLLYALGHLQRTGSASVSFADAEPGLRRLLEEFGPPREPHPEYPFHHLTTDGLWIVRTPQGVGSPGARLSALRSGATGELAPGFAQDIEADPRLFTGVVQGILDANFPATLHADILDAVGIDLEAGAHAEVLTLGKERRRRDPVFRENVLAAYEYRCAVCGFDGQLLRETVGIDAAHVRWWAAQGPDEVANGLALCSLHHKLLDRGAIGITVDYTVAVSSHFIGRSPAADAVVLSLVGSPLLDPQIGLPHPDPAHLQWHTSEVFRAPARAMTA